MPKPQAQSLPSSSPESDATEAAITQLSNTSQTSLRRNLHYLISPSSSVSRSNASSIRLRTRLLLRSLHSLGAFILWRLVRYAKYIAVGSLIAAFGASAFGTLLTPVGWLVAPPTFAASIIAASVWGVGRFAAGRIKERLKRDGKLTARGRGEGGDLDVRVEHAGQRSLGGPADVPW